MSKKISIREAHDIDAENAYRVATDEKIVVVHTNEKGNGLWVDGRQVEGTSQFSLRGVSDKAAKIRRYFSND